MSITKAGLALSNRVIATFIVFAIRHFRNDGGKLGRVNIPKDFWLLLGTKLANSSADRCVFSNDLRNKCGTHFGSSFLFVSKVANESNHVIAIRTAASPMDCAMECAAVEDCLSYNFNNSKTIENNCQLNNATKDSSLPSDYGSGEAEGLVYYQANLVVNNTLTVKGYGAATVKTHKLKNLNLTCSYIDNLFYNFTSIVRYLKRFFLLFFSGKKKHLKLW